MSQDEWQTVEKNTKKRRGSNARSNQPPATGTTVRRNNNNKGRQSGSAVGKPAPASFSQVTSQNSSQHKLKTVIAKPLQKEQVKEQKRPVESSTASLPAPEVKKEIKSRKSLEEYGWNDLKQLRRIIAHLEAIANYSKGGIIGSLRLKTIHNSEDREQDVTPISEIKINAQEDSFMKYIADFVDVESKRDSDMDVLLGFMSILLTCISHIRYYNQEQQIDNYWIYHQEFTYNVWNLDSIPTTLHESIYRELQEKLQSKPLAIDNDKLQLLLNGKGFDFRYDGCLSVPYCLNAMKEQVNCNQSKCVSQRRRLYRYEHKSGSGTRSGNVERAEWLSIAGISKDYKTQVEEFEKRFMNGDGAPVLGLSSIDALLHSVYTSFLKIRKRETPQDLLNRLKLLLLAIPNLVDLPELLQKLNPSGKWCGYNSIQAHPDLSDYVEIKKGLDAFLAREGVKPRSQNTDSICETLVALHEFNSSEEQRLSDYKKSLSKEETETSEETEETEPLQKGYPLSPKFLKVFLQQLHLSEQEVLETYEAELRKISKLPGLSSVFNSLKRRFSNEEKPEESVEETVDIYDQFDEFDQMEADE